MKQGILKSGNFAKTLSPGMEATNNEFPFGWTSLITFWDKNPQYKPIHTYSQIENTSKLAKASTKPKVFIRFESIEASMMSVSMLIKIRGGNFG